MRDYIDQESNEIVNNEGTNTDKNKGTMPKMVTKKKRRRKRKPWVPKRKPTLGNQDSNGEPMVEIEKPIDSPGRLMEALLSKDKNLTYKTEESGKIISYLDLKLNICEGKLEDRKSVV